MAEVGQQRSLREVCELAAHVLPLLNRRFRPAASGMGLGMRSALFALERSGPLRCGELARLEAVAAPTMTRMVSALAERGYVIRRPDPQDGRACLVEITQAGTQALARARQAYADRVEAVLRELRPGELDRVCGALNELVDAGLVD